MTKTKTVKLTKPVKMSMLDIEWKIKQSRRVGAILGAIVGFLLGVATAFMLGA